MRGISEIFPKLFFTEHNYSSEPNIFESIPNFETIRNEVIINLFNKLDLTSNIEEINNIVNCCIEVVENRAILEYIISEKNILQNIFRNLSFNLNLPENENYSNYNYKEILVLLLNILRNVLIENMKIPNVKTNELDEDIVNSGNELEPLQIESSLLGEMILIYLPKILENFQINDNQKIQIETTFGIPVRSIGLTR